MKLSEFKLKLLDEVEHFEDNWIEESLRDSEQYPMELTEDEWWEQWMAATTK